MEENDYKTKFSHSGEVLQRLFEDGKSPLSDQFFRWKLWAKWGEVVGPTMAKHAEPVGYYRGTLWIWVQNSSWMTQMSFMKEQIKSNIEQKMKVNFIREIKFTLDRREVPIDALGQQKMRELIQAVAPKSRDDD